MRTVLETPAYSCRSRFSSVHRSSFSLACFGLIVVDGKRRLVFVCDVKRNIFFSPPLLLPRATERNVASKRASERAKNIFCALFSLSLLLLLFFFFSLHSLVSLIASAPHESFFCSSLSLLLSRLISNRNGRNTEKGRESERESERQKRRRRRFPRYSPLTRCAIRNERTSSPKQETTTSRRHLSMMTYAWKERTRLFFPFCSNPHRCENRGHVAL